MLDISAGDNLCLDNSCTVRLNAHTWQSAVCSEGTSPDQLPNGRDCLMRRIADSVCSTFRSAISKLTSLSGARTSLKFIVVLLAVLLPCSLLFFTTGLQATSNIKTVNNPTDPASISGNGFCTLREAINNANSASDTTGGACAIATGTDTINFSVSGTITIGGSLPAIAHNLTVDGSGQTITVDGAGLYLILVVNSGATLNLNKLTIAHGQGTHGGGILNHIGGSLTVTNSSLLNNSARSRCALDNDGGTANISNSTLAGNASGDGCGIVNSSSGTLAVSNSTFSDNQATNARGADIFLDSGTVSVTNSTFFGNNRSDASIFRAGGSITFTNSILTGYFAPGNCDGTIIDGGHNISSDASCGFGTSTGANGQTLGDNVNPLLDPSGLQNNGGPTQTIGLQSTSPAIDAIPTGSANCPGTDQRGTPRPDSADGVGGACDIGAFEYGTFLVPTPTATPTPTPKPTAPATATAPPTATATATATRTTTPTATATPTATETATPTATATATETATPTSTATPTATPTPHPPTTVTVPGSLAFGNSPVGDTVTKNITVQNTGTNLLFMGSVTSNDPEFAATGATTCPGGGLAHLATCTIAIGFTPSTLGAHSATLSVNDNASSSPQHVAASGTGTVDMTVTPTSFGFGSVKDGSKATKVITVHNYQTNPVSLSESFSGPNAGDFSVTGGTCTCTLLKTSACSLIVTFAPTGVGTESATMTVTDGPDPLGPYTVSFSALATIPESLSATKLVFGNVYQTASKTLNITVTNHATGAPITLTGTSIGGANAGDFAVTGGSCGGSLAAASSCTYAVTFTPSTETAESGTLSIGVAEDPNGGPPAVGLSGTGVTPLKVLPASLAFGTIAGGHSSVNKTVTVTNYGGAALTISESIGGTNPGDFAVTGGTCSGTLAGGGADCTYLLKFTPSIVGAESATLGVSAAGDGASPHNVSLSGTGS